MKKYCISIALMLAGYNAKTQILISLLLGDKLNSDKLEFGLEGGINWSSLRNLEGANNMSTFNLGFYFDIRLKNPSWMLNTGVIVKSGMGAHKLPVYPLGDPALDSAFKGGEIARRLDYFNVPVLLKYNFKNHFYLKSGVQLGLKYNATDQFENSVKDDKDLKYKLKIKDQFHPLDAGLVLGAGYRLMKGNGMNIGAQYYLGLVDVYIDDNSPNQYNRVFYITACIPIGKNKKNKDKPDNKN